MEFYIYGKFLCLDMEKKEQIRSSNYFSCGGSVGGTAYICNADKRLNEYMFLKGWSYE
jgi:hypothetical protein